VATSPDAAPAAQRGHPSTHVPAARAGLSVGLLSGGDGGEELERAGAYRVYEDPADLLRHLDEIGVRAAV
jgi:hypothetical protein